MVEVRDELENNESTLDSSINVKMTASSEKHSFKEGDIVWAKAKRSKAFWPAKIQETNVEVDDLNESKSQTADKRGIKQPPLVKVVLYGSGKIELVSPDNLKVFKSPDEFNDQYKKTSKSKEFKEAIGEAEKDLKMSTRNEQPSEELETVQHIKPTEEDLANDSINTQKQQNDDTAMVENEETSVSPKLSGAKKETPPQKPTRLSIQPSPCLRPIVRASIATGMDMIKTPPKQITEREKQRREMNKLKGQNLVECLNKHIEVYQKVKSSQLELSSKKENEKGKSLKRSRSFDTRKETEKNVADENQSNISRSQIEIPQKSNEDEDEEKNEESNEAKTKRTKTVDDLKRLLEDDNMLSLSMPKSSKFTADLLDESRNHSPKSIEKKENNSSQKSQSSKTKNKNTTSTFKYSNVSILVNGEEKATRDEVKNLIEQLRELIATVDLEDEDDEKRISVYDISLTSSDNAENIYGLNEATSFDSDRKKAKKRKKADDSDSDKTSNVRIDFEQNIDSISRPTSSTKLVISLLSKNNRRLTDDDSDDEENEQDSSKTTLIEEILVRQTIKNIDVVSLRPLSKSNSTFFHYWLKENGANFLELAFSQRFGVVYAMSANKSFFCSLKPLIDKLIKNNSKIEFLEPGQNHSIMAITQELDSGFKQMVDSLKLVKNLTCNDELKEVINEALNN